MNPLFRLDYILLVAAIGLFALGWLSWQSAVRLPRAGRITAVLLRSAAVLLLALLAANPGRWVQPPSLSAATPVVLIDRSESMQQKDVNGRSRWEAALRAVQDLNDGRQAADTVPIFTFAQDLEAIEPEALNAAQADGHATDLLGAGHAILNRYASGAGRLSGMIVISDGRQTIATDRDDLALRARAANVPIVCVPLGGDIPKIDMSIKAQRRFAVTFGRQHVRIPVTVRNQNLGDVRVVVRALDPQGQTLTDVGVELANNTQDTVYLTLGPQAAGYSEIEIVTDVWPTERTVVNNRDRVGVLCMQSRLNILIVEGTPHWDSKFLTQLLRAEASIDVTSVYRVSAERFFRIDTRSDQAEQITETIFPDTLEGLNAYDVIIFGKGAEYFLNPERVSLLKTYLMESGGRVIFARGKPYVGTFDALAAIEPVEWLASRAEQLTFAPSEDGRAVGLFGAMLPDPDDALWANLPPLDGATRVASVHGFAQVLAEGLAKGLASVASPGASVPVLISRRIGRGVVLLMNADGLWKWDFFPGQESSAKIYDTLWVQMVFWAITYGEFLPGQQVSMRLDHASLYPGQRLHVMVSARAFSGSAPLPSTSLIRPDGRVEPLILSQRPGSNLFWDGFLNPTLPGLYRIELSTSDATNSTGARALFEVLAPPQETDQLSADPAFLAELAESSGGAIFSGDRMEEAWARVRPAPANAESQEQAIWDPLWDRAWVLLVIFAILVSEWTLRRRCGLL